MRSIAPSDEANDGRLQAGSMGWLARLAVGTFIALTLVLTIVPVVPIFIASHSESIRSSAERHGTNIRAE